MVAKRDGVCPGCGRQLYLAGVKGVGPIDDMDWIESAHCKRCRQTSFRPLGPRELAIIDMTPLGPWEQHDPDTAPEGDDV